MPPLIILYMKKHLLLLTTAILTFVSLPSQAITRQKLAEYASSLKGKKKAELKDALHALMKDATTLSYGSGNNKTWWGFYVTDKDADGYVIDRYSNKRRKFTSRGSVPSGMNIEHSFAKSWWGGKNNQAYRDLYNLMPSDQEANSSKSNYGMGIVTNATQPGNGCIKVGTGENGMNLWQPSSEWEGDFARGYMYMATTYQDLTWQGEGLKSLQNDNWPTLQKWAYTLYLNWSRTDKVSQVEVNRNNAVYEIQGNRNLFVDYPTLCEYIWGDSTDVAFNPETAITTTTDDTRYATYSPSGSDNGDGGDNGDNGDNNENGGSDNGDSGNNGDGDGDGSGDTTPTPEGYLFYEPFDDVTKGNNSETGGSNNSFEKCSHISSSSTAFAAGGAVRLGSSSKKGSITTNTIEFGGGQLTVMIDVKGWTNIEGKLDVTLTGSTKQTVSYKATISDDFETVTLTFNNVSANPTLTIATTSKRAFIDNIRVFDPTATSIDSVARPTTSKDNGTYTMSGQRLNKKPTKPGLYIVNGKKIIIR